MSYDSWRKEHIDIKGAINYDEKIIKYNIIACLKPTMTYMQMHDQ